MIVISEFRTRGPNGANDEFVEIFNKGTVAVDIGGWKLRGSSSSGTITTRMTITSGTVLLPGSHFLATNSGGYSGTVGADQSYGSGFANDGGIAITRADDSLVDDPICTSIRVSEAWLADMDKTAKPLFQNMRKGLQ